MCELSQLNQAPGSRNKIGFSSYQFVAGKSIPWAKRRLKSESLHGFALIKYTVMLKILGRANVGIQSLCSEKLAELPNLPGFLKTGLSWFDTRDILYYSQIMKGSRDCEKIIMHDWYYASSLTGTFKAFNLDNNSKKWFRPSMRKILMSARIVIEWLLANTVNNTTEAWHNVPTRKTFKSGKSLHR